MAELPPCGRPREAPKETHLRTPTPVNVFSYTVKGAALQAEVRILRSECPTLPGRGAVTTATGVLTRQAEGDVTTEGPVTTGAEEAESELEHAIHVALKMEEVDRSQESEASGCWKGQETDSAPGPPEGTSPARALVFAL